VFAHIDSLPCEAREPAFDILVERVKAHMAAVCFTKIVDTEERSQAISDIEHSKTFHSRDVESPIQPGCWQCGYNVMYATELMTRNNCKLLKSINANANRLLLRTLYSKDAYDATQFRAKIATWATQASEDQMLSRWIHHAAAVDSTVWLPCQVLETSDLGNFGVWHRLSYQIGTNSVRMWCKLPTNDCAYWKHTH
jgi:predicted Zn-ribbon and HTH transcriptional regulator